MENKFKENRLGNCNKLDLSILLKDDLGNPLTFKETDSVMFVCCQRCGSLFEANQSLANDLIFAANITTETDKNDFPQDLLGKKRNYQNYYLEMDNCDNCDSSAKETKFLAKRMPVKN